MKQIKSRIAITLILLSIHLIQPAHANDAMETEILHHINHYRITHGLSRLTMNPTISKEATQHSVEMARHQLPFGHNKFDQRVKRVSKAIQYTNGCAENVAYNYKSAEDVVKNWLLSPGHRQNIRGHYNLTGIGVARDERGRIYYTQMFVRTNHA